MKKDKEGGQATKSATIHMYEDENQNKLYHDTMLLLKNYCSIEYATKRAKTLQEKRAKDVNSVKLEQRDNDIEMNELMLKEAREALHTLKDLPYRGGIYYHILQLRYFTGKYKSDTALIDSLIEAKLWDNVSKATYYRYKKQAIIEYGTILWGYFDKNSPVVKRFEAIILRKNKENIK